MVGRGYMQKGRGEGWVVRMGIRVGSGAGHDLDFFVFVVAATLCKLKPMCILPPLGVDPVDLTGGIRVTRLKYASSMKTSQRCALAPCGSHAA